MIEIDLRISGLGRAANSRVDLQKLVVHTLLSHDGGVVHYLELCSLKPLAIEVSAPTQLYVEDCTRFYRDERASESMFGGYEVLDRASARHRQTVEDEHLIVLPQPPIIDIVVPENDLTRSCIRAVVPSPLNLPATDSYGMWLKIYNRCEARWGNTISTRVLFRISLRNVNVSNFFCFTLLPPGYKPIPDDLRVDSIPARPSRAELQPITEFELPKTFYVYDEWAPQSYGASWLSNKRGIRIIEDSMIVVSFSASSNTYSARLSAQSFFGGVVVSLVGNILVSAIFALTSRNFSSSALIVAIVISTTVMLSAIWLSFRSLSRRGG